MAPGFNKIDSMRGVTRAYTTTPTTKPLQHALKQCHTCFLHGKMNPTHKEKYQANGVKHIVERNLLLLGLEWCGLGGISEPVQ